MACQEKSEKITAARLIPEKRFASTVCRLFSPKRLPVEARAENATMKTLSRSFRPSVEVLEDRLTPSHFVWDPHPLLSGTSHWGVPGNWDVDGTYSLTRIPGIMDDVEFNDTSAFPCLVTNDMVGGTPRTVWQVGAIRIDGGAHPWNNSLAINDGCELDQMGDGTRGTSTTSYMDGSSNQILLGNNSKFSIQGSMRFLAGKIARSSSSVTGDVVEIKDTSPNNVAAAIIQGGGDPTYSNNPLWWVDSINIGVAGSNLDATLQVTSGMMEADRNTVFDVEGMGVIDLQPTNTSDLYCGIRKNVGNTTPNTGYILNRDLVVRDSTTGNAYLGYPVWNKGSLCIDTHQLQSGSSIQMWVGTGVAQTAGYSVYSDGGTIEIGSELQSGSYTATLKSATVALYNSQLTAEATNSILDGALYCLGGAPDSSDVSFGRYQYCTFEVKGAVFAEEVNFVAKFSWQTGQNDLFLFDQTFSIDNTGAGVFFTGVSTDNTTPVQGLTFFFIDVKGVESGDFYSARFAYNSSWTPQWKTLGNDTVFTAYS